MMLENDNKLKGLLKLQTFYQAMASYLPWTVTIIVIVTVRVPVRCGEVMVEVHLYSAVSLELSGLNVRVGFLDVSTPSLSHRKILLLTLNDSSPLTPHVREYLCPSTGCPLKVTAADSAGSACI